MSLVFAGICSHGPGITSRPETAPGDDYAVLRAGFERLRLAIEASRPDALLVVSAEHFANFFMDNMPTFAVGMADYYDGPIEDEAWLKIARVRVPGVKALSTRLIETLLEEVDVAFSEEWKLDHGVMVPLHHLTPRYDLPIIPVNINCQAFPLTPLKRAYAFGQALRRACDAAPERIALIGTGGTSHWPCTPDSGRINQDWDLRFLDRLLAQDVAAVTAYSDADIYRDAGQGGLEIRTSIAVAGAAGGRGELWSYQPIPAFACGCLVATVGVAPPPPND